MTVKPILALGAAAVLLAACDTMPVMQPAPRYSAPVAQPTPAPEAAPAPAVVSPPIAARPEPVIEVPASSTDGCGADSLQAFVGSVAPQPFPAPGPVRVYAEGDPITMDHNPNRVNVVVDRENRQRVVSISCG